MLGQVRRFVPIGALLAGLVLALPSTAQVGSGKIAFGTGGGVFTVDPDGNGAALFRANATPLKWSPDGSSAAYLTGAAPDAVSLMVANADGSGEHVAVSGNISWPFGSPFPYRPSDSWSPDGSRISYLRNANDVYTASAAGGDERRLTSDGVYKGVPVWSPPGLLLAYSAGPGSESTELFVVGADGTGQTQITHSPGLNDQPAWSPDGSSIAFYRRNQSELGAIYVIHPDGSDVHRVADAVGLGEPAWSPDGTTIAFTTSATSAHSPYGSGREIYAVNADGSGVTRLTELGPQFVADSSPTWSPDGDRLLFERARLGGPTSDLYTMNADGSCEGLLTPNAIGFGNAFGASWRPVPGGAPIGDKRCHALSVETTLTDLVAMVSIYANVKNEGTEPLTNVMLTATPRNDLSLTDARAEVQGGRCSTANGRVTCWVPRLERGQTILFAMLGRPRRVGLDRRSRGVALTSGFEVTASEELLSTHRESVRIFFQSARCSVRDWGAGRIDGTRFPDRICGRQGADRIHAGKGKDIVAAGAGNDVIFAQDPNADRISCGPGHDLVIANAKDRVARDCERVRRR